MSCTQLHSLALFSLFSCFPFVKGSQFSKRLLLFELLFHLLRLLVFRITFKQPSTARSASQRKSPHQTKWLSSEDSTCILFSAACSSSANKAKWLDQTRPLEANRKARAEPIMLYTVNFTKTENKTWKQQKPGSIVPLLALRYVAPPLFVRRSRWDSQILHAGRRSRHWLPRRKFARNIGEKISDLHRDSTLKKKSNDLSLPHFKHFHDPCKSLVMLNVK